MPTHAVKRQGEFGAAGVGRPSWPAPTGIHRGSPWTFVGGSACDVAFSVRGSGGGVWAWHSEPDGKSQVLNVHSKSGIDNARLPVDAFGGPVRLVGS
jgi:hypothetical protein